MTEMEFFEKVYQKYQESNHLLEGDGGFNIKRGMAHVISGYLEDLFALYIAQKVNRKDVEYFVDKVISIRFFEKEKAKSFKPDLAIIDNGVMTHYFDLKSNLGWNPFESQSARVSGIIDDVIDTQKRSIDLFLLYTGHNEKYFDLIIRKN